MKPVLRHLTALSISLGVSVAYGYTEEWPLKRSLLFGFAFQIIISAILIFEARRARVGSAEHVEATVVVQDESGEALLVTGEKVRGQENLEVERLTTRRLGTGEVLLRTNDVRLVGAAETQPWTARFEKPTLARARPMVRQGPLVALKLGRERSQPLELLALNVDTGATTWRVRPERENSDRQCDGSREARTAPIGSHIAVALGRASDCPSSSSRRVKP